VTHSRGIVTTNGLGKHHNVSSAAVVGTGTRHGASTTVKKKFGWRNALFGPVQQPIKQGLGRNHNRAGKVTFLPQQPSSIAAP